MRRSFQTSPNAYYREMDGEKIMGELLHTVTTMPTERRSGCPFDPLTELLDARFYTAPSATTPSPAENPAG